MSDDEFEYNDIYGGWDQGDHLTETDNTTEKRKQSASDEQDIKRPQPETASDKIPSEDTFNFNIPPELLKRPDDLKKSISPTNDKSIQKPSLQEDVFEEGVLGVDDDVDSQLQLKEKLNEDDQSESKTNIKEKDNSEPEPEPILKNRPVVTMIKAKFHLGSIVDTERLIKWLWNAVLVPVGRKLEICDSHGNMYEMYPSGKVTASTTRLTQNRSEVQLRKHCRFLARTVQRAIQKDLVFAGDAGAGLPNPNSIKFLGYKIFNLFASWKLSFQVDLVEAQKLINTPRLSNRGFSSMLAEDGISLMITLRDPLPRMSVRVQPSGLISFHGALNEQSIHLVAEVLLEEVLRKQQLLDEN